MMTYRTSFIIELIIELGYIAWLVVFYEILFANVNSIAGWSRPEVMFLISLSIIFTELMTGLFYVWNTRVIPERVRNGTMDFFLLKPIDNQFSLTAIQIYPSSFLGALVGLFMLVQTLPELNTAITLTRLFAGSIIFLCGIAIGYAIMTILSSLTITFINANFLVELPYQIFKFSEKPHSIYFGVLKFVLFLIIPIVFMASVPADVMVRNGTLWYVPMSIAITAAALFLTRKVWIILVNRYSSASS